MSSEVDFNKNMEKEIERKILKMESSTTSDDNQDFGKSDIVIIIISGVISIIGIIWGSIMV